MSRGVDELPGGEKVQEGGGGGCRGGDRGVMSEEAILFLLSFF
jgi:hypothetical protein